MKVLALDLGDVWVGVAISDPLRIIARPFQTIKAVELLPFLHELFKKESIEIVVIGNPRTMRDSESLQTKKVLAQKELLDKEFPTKKCILWDERLSSKQAKQIQRQNAKIDSKKEHAIAAALVLETYLQFLK